MVYCIVILFLLSVGLRLAVICNTHDRFFLPTDVIPLEWAVVFGCGLLKDGSPTRLLRERVEMAVELYRLGKIKRILVSGDEREYYDEPGAMCEYAESLGVPRNAIVLDQDGDRTFETIKRAKEQFGIDQAILVTQAFHLYRAIYIADHCGMTVEAVPACGRKHDWFDVLWWNFREIPATVRALIDVHTSWRL